MNVDLCNTPHHMALKNPPIAIHQAAVFRACRSFEVPPGQNRAQEQTNSGTCQYLPETKQLPFYQQISAV